jgi:predicted transcriptional regulator
MFEGRRLLGIPPWLLGMALTNSRNACRMSLKERKSSKYDEDTLKWLRDKTNYNILRSFQNNLNNISSTARHELLKAGLIIKSFQNGRIELTEKGLSFMKEVEEDFS